MIAIVIPYYKLTFFEATLQSLANQTDQRFQVYIGDDASPEDPSLLLEKYKGQIDFLYHRFENNLGGISLTQQWERCIALSGNEEWIMILGDDDVLVGNTVESFYIHLQEIEQDQINVVRYATQKIDEKGNSISGFFFHPKIESAVDFLFRKTRSSFSEYVFKKDIVKEIGFRDFPLGWGSDKLFVFELSDSRNIFTINNSNIYIRISNISISGKESNIELKNKAIFYYHQYIVVNYFILFSNLQKKIFIEEWKKSSLILSGNELKMISRYFRNNFMLQDLINMKLRIYRLNYLIKKNRKKK